MLLQLAYGLGYPIMCVKFEEISQNLRKTSERRTCPLVLFERLCLRSRMFAKTLFTFFSELSKDVLFTFPRKIAACENSFVRIV